MKKKSERGQTLMELLVVISMVGIAVAASGSAMETIRQRAALKAATSELRALFQRVRIMAIVHDRNMAIKFRPENDGWSYAVYQDGDGDGVRNDDISRGRDTLVDRPRRFEHPPARIGVPFVSVPDPMSSGDVLTDRLPVRFGTSTLCSFSREGEATNGSVVLTDGKRAVLIRVHGTSALVTVWRWEGRWRQGS